MMLEYEKKWTALSLCHINMMVVYLEIV